MDTDSGSTCKSTLREARVSSCSSTREDTAAAWVMFNLRPSIRELKQKKPVGKRLLRRLRWGGGGLEAEVVGM
jgi:hypothetical protein